MESDFSKPFAAQPIVCRQPFDYARRRCEVSRRGDAYCIVFVGGYVFVLSRMQVMSSCEYARVAAQRSRQVVGYASCKSM